ncbi:MAG: hypothetical protein ABFD64_03485 [Armatimonadota bacterium]
MNYKKPMHKNNTMPSTAAPRSRRVFHLLIACSVVLSIILAYFTTGFKGDINCFTSWGQYGFTNKLLHIYDTPPKGIFLYPPLGMYLCVITNYLGSFFGISPASQLWVLMLKLLPIIATALGAYIVRAIVRQYQSEKIAFYCAVLYAFNPALLMNGPVFGQWEPILLLCVLGMIWCMVNRKEWAVGPILAFALLIKPLIIISVPLIIYSLIVYGGMRKFILSVLWGCVAFSLVILPFIIVGTAVPLAKTLFAASDVSPIKSIQAANFWCLYQTLETIVTGTPNLSSGHGSFLGVASCKLVGQLAYMGFLLFIMLKWKKQKNFTVLIAGFFLAWFGAFHILTGMSARYILTAVGFSALLPMVNRRYAILYFAVSVIAALNILLVYLFSQPAGVEWPIAVKYGKCLLAVINLLLFGFAIGTFLSHIKNDTAKISDNRANKLMR